MESPYPVSWSRHNVDDVFLSLRRFDRDLPATKASVRKPRPPVSPV
jgi:hypothetical protein